MHGPGDVRLFDRFARLYDLVMPPVDAEALAAGLERADRPIECLLDVAGGTGRAAAGLRVPERVVVDASAGMLRRARDRGLDAVRGDAGRLPVRDGGVDGAVVVDAFHHLPDQRAAVRELARVLAPGGAVAVRDFDPATLLGRGLVAGENVIGMGSVFWTPEELVRAMDEAGLDAAVVERGFAFTVVGVKRKRE